MNSIHGPKIVIVDDEEVIRQLVSQGLNNIGLTNILECCNAGSAIVVINNTPTEPDHCVDLVLTDFCLPDDIEGGGAIALAAKAHNPNTKVIMMSGSAKLTGDPVGTIEKYGLDAFIAKPATMAAIMDSVKRCLSEKMPAAVVH